MNYIFQLHPSRGVWSRGAYGPDESNQGGHMPSSKYETDVI